ncbi:penicillin-binding transpeptidase domain-containing protein [Streptomyces sp. M19]
MASPATRKHVMARWGTCWTTWSTRAGWRRTSAGSCGSRARRAQARTGLGGQAGYFVDAARRELIASGVSEQELAAGGWTITLTVDRAPARPEKAVAARLDGAGKHPDPDVQAGAVSVDSDTGSIVALYGGRNYTEHYLDNATRADYQAGPAFEPILLADALNRKMARRPVVDAVDRTRTEEAKEEAEEEAKRVKETAVGLGLNPDTGGYGAEQALKRGLIGAGPMELAGVYATLNHHGRKVTLSIVASAHRGGEHADVRDAVGGQAIDREAADAVTANLLSARDGGKDEQAVVAKGAVARAAGPTDDGKAAWFVGYTPELVTAVGLFGEHHKTGKQVALKHAGTTARGGSGTTTPRPRCTARPRRSRWGRWPSRRASEPAPKPLVRCGIRDAGPADTADTANTRTAVAAVAGR